MHLSSLCIPKAVVLVIYWKTFSSIFLLEQIEAKNYRRTRNIQAQLSALLPDNITEWRRYRPRDQQQGIYRLAQFRRCNENQMSKYTQRRAKRYLKANGAAKSSTKDSAKDSAVESTAPFYNPYRHYDYILPGGVPSHLALPQLSQWYSHQLSNLNHSSCTAKPDLDSRSSDKEAFIEVDRDHSDLHNSNQQLPGNNSIPTLSVDTNLIANTTEDMASLPPIELDPRALKDPDVTRSSGISIRTMSTRLSSRMSRSLRHINSVFSASNSWRSSLISASTMSSGRLESTTNVSNSRHDLIN